MVPELPTDTSSLTGENRPPVTRHPDPTDSIFVPSARSACTVKVTWRAAVRSTIVLCPGASAASISARWAWYLDGGIASSPTSGAWAFATSRRTGGRITSRSRDSAAAGHRPPFGGSRRWVLDQLLVNEPAVSTPRRPAHAAFLSLTSVNLSVLPFTLNL